jgi:hypothetical protein
MYDLFVRNVSLIICMTSQVSTKNKNSEVRYKLSLNLSKKCCMVFPPNQRNKVEIVVDGFKIGNVSQCKYLGITLDDDLKRSTHIDLIYSKLFKFTSIFYKLRSKLPPSIPSRV